MDRLTQLQTYVAVAEAGSFTAAAERLGLTRAMTSRHVLLLEDRLGVRLLQRTTRRVSLTEAGAGYLDRARRLLADFDDAESEIRGERATARGRLRVSAPVSFGRVHLAAAIPAFMALNPGLSVELTANDRFVDLIEEGYDVAVRVGQLGDSTLVARRLGAVAVRLAASPAYLAARGTPATPDDLASHEWLGYTLLPRAPRLRHPDGREAALRVAGSLTSNNGDMLAEVAAAGGGIVFEPDFVLQPYFDSGRLVPLLQDWQGPELGVHAVHHQSRYVAGKVRAFVDHLAGWFRQPAA